MELKFGNFVFSDWEFNGHSLYFRKISSPRAPFKFNNFIGFIGADDSRFVLYFSQIQSLRDNWFDGDIRGSTKEAMDIFDNFVVKMNKFSGFF